MKNLLKCLINSPRPCGRNVSVCVWKYIIQMFQLVLTRAGVLNNHQKRQQYELWHAKKEKRVACRPGALCNSRPAGGKLAKLSKIFTARARLYRVSEKERKGCTTKDDVSRGRGRRRGSARGKGGVGAATGYGTATLAGASAAAAPAGPRSSARRAAGAAAPTFF